MKRLAGEGGVCFASQNKLAERMGVHKTTVAKTIEKLLKRNWIQETEKLKVAGGQVRQFIIIDLWPLNIKEYESGAEMTTSKELEKKSGAKSVGGGAHIARGGAKSDTTNNSNKIKNNKEAINKLKNHLQERFNWKL